MKLIHDNRWEVTKPTPIVIGQPEMALADEVLREFREAVASTGALLIYWFWISIEDDIPHLGLAVSPPDDTVIAKIGFAIEPIWRRYSPHYPVFDILRLGDANLDRVIVERGKVLFKSEEAE